MATAAGTGTIGDVAGVAGETGVALARFQLRVAYPIAAANARRLVGWAVLQKAVGSVESKLTRALGHFRVANPVPATRRRAIVDVAV